MARIIVFQHVPYEILGTMNSLFKEQAIRIKYVNFGRHPDSHPNIDGYHGLVVLGGPMNVDEIAQHPHLATEVKLIQRAMANNIPILGICLGAQLIAKANGAVVKKNTQKEIGWYKVRPTEAGEKDPLIQHFNGSEKIFQWHGDTFELPENSVHLASSELCKHQAFRIRNNIYGLQFHLEVDQALIERWLTVPAHIEELKKLQGVIDPEQIRRDTRAYIKNAHELSDKVFRSFSQLLGHQENHKFKSR